MRPSSHREQSHDRCCGTCRHSAVPEYKDHLLCFHGDDVVFRGPGLRAGTVDVILNDDSVGLMEGDEYDHVWGGRVVDTDDVCDEWEQEQKGGE